MPWRGRGGPQRARGAAARDVGRRSGRLIGLRVVASCPHRVSLPHAVDEREKLVPVLQLREPAAPGRERRAVRGTHHCCQGGRESSSGPRLCAGSAAGAHFAPSMTTTMNPISSTAASSAPPCCHGQGPAHASERGACRTKQQLPSTGSVAAVT